MARIYPFKAFRYNAEKAGAPLSKLVTQPYDKISPAMQEKYYQAHPNNLVRIILGKKEPSDNGENVYTRAAGFLEEWTRGGVLRQEEQPALYPYFQEYTVPGTRERKVRKGFIGLGRIEDYEAGVVHRHELTLTGPKKDRMELLRHTRAHFGQIFMIYSDPKMEIDRLLDRFSAEQPPYQVEDDYGAVHRLWVVTDVRQVKQVQELMADKKLIIADGHHRYETAVAYRNECRQKAGGTDPEAPHEKVMMTFINMEAPGVTILPTHRVVGNLPRFDFNAFRDKASQYFDWYAYPVEGRDKESATRRLLRDLAERGEKRASFAVLAGHEPAYYLFLLKVNVDLNKALPDVSARQRELDLVILHKLLLERSLGLDEEAVRAQKNLTYVREWTEAAEMVERGEAQVAFLVNPIRADQVRDVALGGETLPQKSTDFYPKLLSGLTIYKLDTP